MGNHATAHNKCNKRNGSDATTDPWQPFCVCWHNEGLWSATNYWLHLCMEHISSFHQYHNSRSISKSDFNKLDKHWCLYSSGN